MGTPTNLLLSIKKTIKTSEALENTITIFINVVIVNRDEDFNCTVSVISNVKFKRKSKHNSTYMLNTKSIISMSIYNMLSSYYENSISLYLVITS